MLPALMLPAILSVVRHRNINYRRVHPLRLFHSNQNLIMRKYRMGEVHLRRLCSLLAPLMPHQQIANWTVDVENKVIIALRYFATNAHQAVLADTIGVCQKTVSNAIEEVVKALNHPAVVRKFLPCHLNDVHYCRRKADGFARLGALPNVVGAIDGTLIPILKPAYSGWEYYCRKGFCAINVLAVVDAHGRFMYINSNYPGSVHDSTVYNYSRLHDAFVEGAVPEGYCLIGDSGFTNTNEILTPYRNPQDRAQHRFNTTHRKMRVVVECVFGKWKGCFKILQKLRVRPEKAAQIIMACAVLHNIMISMRCRPIRHLGRRIAHMAHPRPGVANIRQELTRLLV